jgi:hypothetical protein
MFRRLSSTAALLTLVLVHGVAARAQEQGASRGQDPALTASKPQEGPLPNIPRAVGQLMNIRLEFTITDSRGTAPPTTSKTVTMVLSDRASGRIRTQGEVRTPDGRRLPITLNLDAQPEITRDNRVKVNVTLEYKPQAGEGETEERATTSIGETMTVILDDGKPLVVSQSADPHSDRKVKIEMKATFLK